MTTVNKQTSVVETTANPEILVETRYPTVRYAYGPVAGGINVPSVVPQIDFSFFVLPNPPPGTTSKYINVEVTFPGVRPVIVLSVTQTVSSRTGSVSYAVTPQSLTAGFTATVEPPNQLVTTIILRDTVRGVKYSFPVRSFDPDALGQSTASVTLTVNPATGGQITSSTFAGVASRRCILTMMRREGEPLNIYNDLCVSGVSPQITIEAVTAAQNRNFGEGFFTVTDSIPHAGTFDGKNPITPEGIISQFCEFPQFNEILKGKGVNLYQKFRSIIRHYHLDPDIDLFTGHMALYAYSKYILSRLLYGRFSVEYLARNFNARFLRDLEASEYSDFIVIFTDPQYGVVDFGRYFKCLDKR